MILKQMRQFQRAASPPHLNVASVHAQEIRVANRIEFSNSVSLNAAIVQKILSRLQAASKDISVLQTTTQLDIDALKSALDVLKTTTQNDINEIKGGLATTQNDVVAVKEDVTLIQMNMGSLATRLGDAEAAISDVKNLILSLNLADFVDLLPRVVAAETTIININATLQILGDEIKSVTDLLSSSIVIF
jgi:hypothetical protein